MTDKKPPKVVTLCGTAFDEAAQVLSPNAKEEDRVRGIFAEWAKLGAKSFAGVVVRHDGHVSVISSRNDSAGTVTLLRQGADVMQLDAFEGLLREYGIDPDDDDDCDE